MINKTIVKQSFKAISIGLLLSSPITQSATYDLFEEQTSESLISPNNIHNESFLNFDFSQQKDTENQKKVYLETIKLIKNKQLKEAENKISLLLKENPEKAEFYNLQALLAVFKKEPDLAVKSYQKAINLDPKNLTAHLAIAQLFLVANNLSQAKEYANKILAINDKTTHAYFILAEIARKNNKLENVEKLLLTAKNKNLGDLTQEIKIAYNLGKLYVIQEQPHKTLLLAEDIVNRYPKEISVLSILANAQLANNQKEQAKQTLLKLINQEKQNTQYRFMLARLLVEQPDNEKDVLKLLDEISSIAPSNPQVLVQQAAYFIKLKKFHKAHKLAAQINKLIPQTGFGHLIEGETYLAEKNPDQALLALQQTYKIKPNQKVLFLIVDILTTKGKQIAAIDLLNKELKGKTHNNQAIHFKLAVIYQQLKNAVKTEKHYQAILSLNPNHVLALNNLAWHYYEHNNPKALALAEQAYKLAPKSANVADTYGSILVKQNNPSLGIEVFKKAINLAPMAYDIQYHLAKAYEANGNHKQAVETLNRIIKTEQNFSEKNAAITLLKELGKN